MPTRRPAEALRLSRIGAGVAAPAPQLIAFNNSLIGANANPIELSAMP